MIELNDYGFFGSSLVILLHDRCQDLLAELSIPFINKTHDHGVQVTVATLYHLCWCHLYSFPNCLMNHESSSYLQDDDKKHTVLLIINSNNNSNSIQLYNENKRNAGM
jgi:hypothetical protein